MEACLWSGPHMLRRSRGWTRTQRLYLVGFAFAAGQVTDVAVLTHPGNGVLHGRGQPPADNHLVTRTRKQVPSVGAEHRGPQTSYMPLKPEQFTSGDHFPQ